MGLLFSLSRLPPRNRLRLLTVLLPQLRGLKTLKYIQYSGGFQTLIWNKISRHQLLPISHRWPSGNRYPVQERSDIYLTLFAAPTSQSKERNGDNLKESIYKSYDELPLFLNAEMVAKLLGVSPSSAYELMHEKGFPAMRVGNRLIVPKAEFQTWVQNQINK